MFSFYVVGPLDDTAVPIPQEIKPLGEPLVLHLCLHLLVLFAVTALISRQLDFVLDICRSYFSPSKDTLIYVLSVSRNRLIILPKDTFLICFIQSVSLVYLWWSCRVPPPIPSYLQHRLYKLSVIAALIAILFIKMTV